MAAEPDLHTHSVTIQDGPAYDARGQLAPVRFVTYMLGSFGPFVLTGPSAELNEAEIHRRVALERAGLQKLLAGLT